MARDPVGMPATVSCIKHDVLPKCIRSTLHGVAQIACMETFKGF